ncbi:hypothetical protein V5T82_17505 [Magnetovibrio sp. PR-2]|uniref:hypothetical protein n=1 Tax=Magnetovibrio sp. PR-2 TaxID=3120356 RepID=UPI002FCE0380
MLSLLKKAGAEGHVPLTPGIQEASGDVRLNGLSAKKGDEVRPGDVCSTGADGSCTIIIGHHSYLLREDSVVEFYTEHFEEGLERDLSGEIRLFAGSMLSVFAPTRTNIVTPMATIGIRGTACYVSVEKGRTYACVCYGGADLKSAQSGELLETVATQHHDSPRYIYETDAPKLIEKAPVIDHTDAELRMLEALVGRIPAFDKPGAPPYDYNYLKK